MQKKEKQLFLKLCSFLSSDREKIKKLIEQDAATPELLGYLFANRMAGVAYGELEKAELLSLVDREFRNSLKGAWMLNKMKNSDFVGCVKYLSTELDSCEVPYALLKGAYLCGKYPIGYRTSNDIDVLICPEDVGKVSAKLRLAGFRQGYIKDGVFVAATRAQIIESKMNRGETVPFIKEIKLPYIKYLEVDLNFSLDYKNSDDGGIRKMLERTQTINVGGARIRTLCPEDFFLHLCAHLYKEATTLPWIKMKRDMTFYKYVDIYMLLNGMDDDMQQNVIKKAIECGLETELSYCMNSVKSFFELSKGTLIEFFDESYNNEQNDVVAPMEKKIYTYGEQDIVKRFFARDRLKLLKEATE